MRVSKFKAKEPVRIRYKNLSNGNRSIYFDIYKDGNRFYEFPKLYIIPERTTKDKELNRQTNELANSIKAKRIIELQNKTYGFNNNGIGKKANLLLYIENVAIKHLEKTTYKRGLFYNLKSLSYHLKQYKGEKITFADIDKKFVQGFIQYLATAKSGIKYKDVETPNITSNTGYKLFNLLKSTLNKAINDEIIDMNPCNKIALSEKPKQIEGKREHLTIDEVKKLIETDCKNDMVKCAFIFCCLTGIRWSDIKKIKYENLKKDSAGYIELEFRQQKTKGMMYLQISNEACKWVPEQKEKSNNDNVFILPKNESANIIIKNWCQKAGISKLITFHCSRHTAATLNLSLGTPIEVVSKLLGHSKISTTQIYAKIVNEAKREAVNKQNGIFE